MLHLKTGCCGFPLKIIEYTPLFSVVEVQQTFYQPPRICTLQKWRSMAPPAFEFTLKAWQLITHASKSPTYRRLKIKLSARELEQCGAFQWTPVVRDAWETTRDCARALGAGLLLFQCPASFTPKPENLKQMREFFSRIDRQGLKLLWEPRGNWDAELVSSLCQELDLIHAVDPFVSSTTSNRLVYFRLRGGKDFSHVFTDDELRYVAQLIPAKTPAYVMFNNKNMLGDALRFQTMINGLKKV